MLQWGRSRPAPVSAAASPPPEPSTAGCGDRSLADGFDVALLLRKPEVRAALRVVLAADEHAGSLVTDLKVRALRVMGARNQTLARGTDRATVFGEKEALAIGRAAHLHALAVLTRVQDRAMLVQGARRLALPVHAAVLLARTITVLRALRTATVHA